MAENNQREHYRICYRAPDQPLFECENGKFLILDISEGGFRFSIRKSGVFFSEESLIHGMIVFPEKRGSVAVKGSILRVLQHEIAVQLDEDARVPLAKIMEEQIALIQKGRL